MAVTRTPANVPRQPRWQAADRLRRGRLPRNVRHWLLAADSLTDHLQAHCPGRFRVRPLRQYWRPARADEAATLDIAGASRVRVREVALCCGTRPMVLARTVLPVTSLRGRQRRLLGAGRRPLGAMLFADRSMRREAFTLCRTRLAQAGFPVVLDRDGPVHARRAVFRLGRGPLLVAEYFLPTLIDGVATSVTLRRKGTC